MKKNYSIIIIIIMVMAVCMGLYLDIGGYKNFHIASSNANYNELSNKAYGWGLKKVKASEPDVTQKQKDDLEKYNAFYMDNKKPKKLYLTFDEGYENGYTEVILDCLKEKNVPAAFFITGPYAKKETTLVRRMIDEGHIVGNHTVNHPNLAKLESAEKIRTELSNMNNLVSEMYSYDMKYMRPPEGQYSERVLAVSNDMGMRTVFWSFAYIDWQVNNQKGKEYAFGEVTKYLHDGAVILLHAVSKDNAEALGDIIDYARAQGYEFAPLDEI